MIISVFYTAFVKYIVFDDTRYVAQYDDMTLFVYYTVITKVFFFLILKETLIFVDFGNNLVIS